VLGARARRPCKRMYAVRARAAAGTRGASGRVRPQQFEACDPLRESVGGDRGRLRAPVVPFRLRTRAARSQRRTPLADALRAKNLLAQFALCVPLLLSGNGQVMTLAFVWFGE